MGRGDETARLVREVGSRSTPLRGNDDLDPLLEAIGDARVVLLGEASHGTSEFYSWRARLSRRLIEEKGYSFVAVEGDWPDCYEIDRHVRGVDGSDESAAEVLGRFDRWPTWMWGNWEVVAFAEWLRRHNREHRGDVGFYGLDVYSLWESLEVITDYLEDVDPDAARAAREAFSCFQPYGEDEQAYALSTARLVPHTCEEEVIRLLLETRRTARRAAEDGEAAFNAEQNAIVAVKAEEYYRAMVRGGADSWNLRDTHMADTLDRILEHYGTGSKAIVWAHNTHVGDARATTMARAGMLNIGQMARERYPGDAVLVGFGCHRGSVMAGRSWGAPMEEMDVPPSPEGSWEDVFHRTGEDAQLLILDELRDDESFLRPRGHRAIGVVYDSRREIHNYVPTILPARYDAVLWFDETRALHPLDLHPADAVPESYPWGF